ncbi:class I SAM-dependent methyltransferase [Amaricoccus solimangrovi]|nr:class I SAM-dependent methyltransferase [Amaricoccus solimangrovi]
MEAETVELSGVEARVAAYYGGMGLVERIEEDLGRGFDGDLSPEGARLYGSFHVGGAPAVERLLDAMPPLEGRAVLDIGCGVGGAVRALARRGAFARGVDLTAEFIAVARDLSRMIGADPGIFAVGGARALPYRDRAFDHALMLHVGMNIADKRGAMAEAARVIRPGGTFAIYDIMRAGPGPIAEPQPWSDGPESSFAETPEAYLAAAAPWFTEAARVERREEGVAFVAALLSPAEPRPVSEAMRGKLVNLAAAFRAGTLAPVELTLIRRD